MSRIGKQPVEVPTGVTVEIKDGVIMIKGPKGELSQELHELVKVDVKDNVITVTRVNDSKESRSLHGLTRTLIANMVEGVTKGFEKKLEIVGIGYKAQAKGSKITLNIGYSHPIEYIAPKGIEIKMDEEKKNVIVVSGINKQVVGEAAAKIRSYRKPEPYKGKGIKYIDEHIRRKAGKAASSS